MSQLPTPPPIPPPPPPPSTKANTQLVIGVSDVLSTTLAKRKIEAESAVECVTPATWNTKAYQYFQEKSSTGYVGLSNQGATCYLNSLLQTLYMTPEFRHRLYQWRYDSAIDGPEELCIPLQLQKLFARLQLGKSPIVETKALTRSFCWTEADAFQQNDIQELLRVLFDALETCFTRGGLASDAEKGKINKLYQGTITDYIRCCKCGFTSSRQDAFLDIPLVIRGMKSIDESIRAYIAPEVLDGENQWHCPKCDHKVDAEKGLRFHTLPYFLTLHLKRFDYDVTTWRRIKLNNFVSFPTTLDMSPYISQEEGLHSADGNVPPIYELLSIMIHSGGAMGGHYFAFIKSLKDGKWIKFNDGSVTEVQESDLEQIFGSKSEQATRSSTTNAYMLIYRLVDKKRNIDDVSDSEIPPSVREEIQKENEEYEKAKAEWKKRQNAVHLTVYHNLTGEQTSSFPATSDKNHTLETTIEKIISVAKQTFPNVSLHFEDVRLRPYNPETGTKGPLWTPSDSTKTLSDLQFTPTKAVFLEVRKPDGTFPDEEVMMSVRIVRLKQDTDEFDAPIAIRLSMNATVGDLRRLVEQHTLIKQLDQRLFFSKTQNVKSVTDIIEFTDDTKLLHRDFGVADGHTIHLEQLVPNTPSRILLKFEENANKIQIFYNIPGSIELNQELDIDRRKSIFELKSILSNIIGLPIIEFSIYKGMLAKEFPDESKSLHDYGLSDGSAIVLKQKKDVSPELKLRVFLFNAREELPEKAFEEIFNEVTVSPETSIEDLKMQLLAKLGDRAPPDPSMLRLRVKKANKAANILFSGKTLKESGIKDGSELCVQILDGPETLSSSEMIIQVRQWYPSRQCLAESSEEIIISRNATIFELKALLERVGIPIGYLCVAKPFSYQLTKKEGKSGISSLNWHVEDFHTLTASPWYIQDGDVLLFKDSRDPEVEEKTENTTGPSPYRVPEKGIKIRTIYDSPPTSLQQTNQDNQCDLGDVAAPPAPPPPPPK